MNLEIDMNLNYPYCKDSCNHYKQRGYCTGCGIYEEIQMHISYDKINSVVVTEERATDVQVGGSHYKNYEIQPIYFLQKNNIPFAEASAIKYLLRHREKGGIEDLAKAKHYIDLIIELEYS